MKHIIALFFAAFTLTASAIDQQWHYCYWSDSYIKITRSTGGWNETRAEAATWNAVPYTGDCDSFVGSWLKDPSKNGLNWIFWAQGNPYASVGVSRTGKISWSFPTTPYGNRYGLMEFFPEYIWDPTIGDYYVTSPWDYPGPGLSGGLD